MSNAAWAYQPQEERILPNQDAENDYRTIGEIAEEFNVTLRTLRFYESKGLIKPRREGTTRLYGQEDRARLALILQGKRLGFTLTEIRGMLASYREHGGQRFLNLSREQCRDQIEMLERQKTEIEEALAELRRTYATLHDGATEPGDSRA